MLTRSIAQKIYTSIQTLECLIEYLENPGKSKESPNVADVASLNSVLKNLDSNFAR